MSPKFSVKAGMIPLLLWVFGFSFALLFVLNAYLLPAQVYGSTVPCVAPMNLSNCGEPSAGGGGGGQSTSADLSDATETPLILPDISPESNDLSRSTETQEANLDASSTGLNLDADSVNSAADDSGSDAPRNTNPGSNDNDDNQISGGDDDESEGVSDSDDGESESGSDSSPSLLPFP